MACRAAHIDEAEVVVAADDVLLMDMTVVALARVIVARVAVHASRVTQHRCHGREQGTIGRRRVCRRNDRRTLDCSASTLQRNGTERNNRNNDWKQTAHGDPMHFQKQPSLKSRNP